MKAYLLSAFGVIFLAVITSYIVPEGKLKKTINFILRVVCITVLLTPVGNLISFESAEDSAAFDFDYICSVYSGNQSMLLENKLSDELGIECDCVVAVIFEDDSIKENGVTVYGVKDKEEQKIIVEYLKELGYININVNEESR